MYKSLNLRKDINIIDYTEEVMFFQQLFDGQFAIVSGNLTENKIIIYNDKNFDLKSNNSFKIKEIKSPITSINQTTDKSLLILTLDGIINIIRLLPDNKYNIIQNLNAINSSNNKQKLNDDKNPNKININEKEDNKELYYKKINSRITSMVDFNSCIIMQLSNSLLFSIYDKILKFYQVNIIHNLYEEAKRIELNDIFNEPLELDSSTLTILSWSNKSIRFYNIDTQLLLKRLDNINAYLSVKISEEFFGVIGPQYLYLISIKEQEIKNLFKIPGSYEIRSALCSPSGSLLCSTQTIYSCDIVEFEVNNEEFKEIGKKINPHKNEDYIDGIKMGSSLINTLIITQGNEVISSGSDRKIIFWN